MLSLNPSRGKAISKCLVIILALTFFLTNTHFCMASVVINEILPHPSSGDDWIELFNTEAFEVDISGWIIEDSTSKIKTTPEETKFTTMSAYLQIFVSNRLNNSGDTLKLKNKEGVSVDEKSYNKDPGVDISLGRFPDGSNSWGVLTASSPNSANSNYSPTTTNAPEPTEKPTVTSKSGSKEQVNTVTNSTPATKLQHTLTKTPAKTINVSKYESFGATSPTQVVVGLVLGNIVNGSDSTQVKSASKTKIPVIIFIFLIVIGLGLIVAAAIVSFKKLRSTKS